MENHKTSKLLVIYQDINTEGYNTYLINEIQEANAGNNYLLEYYTNMESEL